MLLEISQNLRENTCARISFLVKLQAGGFIKKEALPQVFSCEFCKISKNTFSYRTPVVAASEWNLFTEIVNDEEQKKIHYRYLTGS